jgi:hypothetical protein
MNFVLILLLLLVLLMLGLCPVFFFLEYYPALVNIVGSRSLEFFIASRSLISLMNPPFFIRAWQC